ncbi:hypothetical protein COLO4_04991 [Corchorus olitorius]|uniref:Uncharacterized protein n=1 Tax=Corchorus olitorius TaxID=93759 RepID=A0A1R3KSA0_9ROSI|nr:hypothetical protein COLO4_04991 [Corchorus olitorius]
MRERRDIQRETGDERACEDQEGEGSISRMDCEERVGVPPGV